MSRRTAAADKAIRIAWERERELVSKRQGTRDWTPEQQAAILDPEQGRALDEYGKTLQGHHMKSVSQYPNDQGNPDNIQFLTREEHWDAHKGNWLTPTNGYYDPVTKQFFDFGEGDIIPCPVINLSTPVVRFDKCNTDEIVEKANQTEEKPCSGADPPTSDFQDTIDSNISIDNPIITPDTKQLPPKRAIEGLSSIANSVKAFSDKHPVATALVKLGVGAAGIYFTRKAVGSISKSKSSENADHNALLRQAIDSLGEAVTNTVNSFDFKKSESALKGLEYTVAKKIGLSDTDRQKILHKIITTGILSKEAVCKYLENYINLHKGQSSFADAVAKWITDLEYVKTSL